MQIQIILNSEKMRDPEPCRMKHTEEPTTNMVFILDPSVVRLKSH